ncbi:hypothetical protein KW460_16625 [Vibrio fluvialis]|nr:hypothetical protein [Vibrio fluvialis]
MTSNITNNKLFFIISFNKIFYLLFATLVFSKFSQLGDTEDYISGHYLYREDFTSPAFILSYLGSSLGELGSYIASMIISGASIIYLIKKSNLSNKLNVLILTTIFFPSFGIWTAILSKEVFVLLFMSLCVGFLIDVHSNRKNLPSIFVCVFFFILFSLKPHYSAAVIFTYFLLLLRNLGVRREFLLSITILSFSIIVPIAIHFIDIIYEYTQVITNSYFVNGGSTRKNDYWIELYDFFIYAPIGVPKAFIGPTLGESINRLSFLPFFIEGVLIFIITLVGSFFSVYRSRSINVLSLCLFITFTLLLMFTHYPVGIVNPGSSIRYRSGIIFPMLVFIFYLVEVNYGKKEKNNIY